MTLTPDQIKKKFEENPQKVAHAFAVTLRDFGYASLTDDYVLQEIERLQEGADAKGGPSMFIKRWLEEGLD